MVEFNRLNDTSFPDIGTVDVYQYQNTFDFSQFRNTQMMIRLLSVPWDLGTVHVGQRMITGIGNVVKFDDDNARDDWFDSKTYAQTAAQWETGEYDGIAWQTQYRQYHDAELIKLPVPWDVACTFNYIEIIYNPAPNATNPLDFESEGILRWHYFIRNFKALAASTTECECFGDIWTTYINRIAPKISGVMLERGHAPFSNVSVADYLAYPIANTDGLLAQDEVFGTLDVVSHTSSLALNSDENVAVFVTTATLLETWGSADDDWNAPTYYEYMADTVPTYTAFAVDIGDLADFLSSIDANYPQFKQTCKGVFFINTDLVTLGSAMQFNGVTVHMVEGNSATLMLDSLTVGHFGYDSKYANLTKLYTYPYSAIEITDETGGKTIVKVEDTNGTLPVNVAVSIAYPYIAIDTHINAIGGSAGDTLEFRNVTGREFGYSGKWYEHLHRWEIPLFAIVQSAATNYDFSTYYDRKQQLATNAKNLENALASNATANTNTLESNQAAYDNTSATASAVKTNADNQASTSKTNSDNSNTTTKGNADRDALAAYNNAIDTANTVKSNADDSAATQYGNAYRNAMANRNRFTFERNLASAQLDVNVNNNYATTALTGYTGFIGASAWENRQKVGDDWDSDYILNIQLTNAQNDYTVATTTLNTVGGVAQNAIGGAISGAMVGGLPGAGGGAVAGLVGGAVSLATASASIPIMCDQTGTLAALSRTAGQQKTNHALTYIANMANIQKQVEVDKYNNETTWLTSAANLVRDTSVNDATDTKSTENTNATRTNTTAKANAGRTYTAQTTDNSDTFNTTATNASNEYTTATTNNQNTYDTAIANANRTKAMADANANRTKATADANARRDKTNADNAVSNAILQAALDAPYEFGEFANGDTAATRPMALFANVVTQSSDAISRTGDYFLKWGYAYNKLWDFDTFNIMNKFTYWKCSDIYISELTIPDEHMDYIRFLLMGGVTVWNTPEDIGNVTIYENGV